MSDSGSRVPMFPLGSVLFPGQSIPLYVFEERYRALVRDLMQLDDPAQRLFGTVAIREGYEVGDTGAQSLYRVGCLVQLTEVDQRPDGSYDVVGVCRTRLRLNRLESGAEYPVGEITELDSGEGNVPTDVVNRALRSFTHYRETLSQWRDDPFEGRLPTDPHYLSWTLAALTPLPLSDRQALLEADTSYERLSLVTSLIDDELSAMRAIPSLPATEVARTRWSPN